jgi:predicted ATP-binding protein involved in virulence
VFCSTHSPFVVNSIDHAWVHVIDLEGHLARPRTPVPSEEARSYANVLATIFGIDQRFGPEIERQLDHFYSLRARLMSGERDVRDQFLSLGQELADASNEVRNIVIPEIRQIEKALAAAAGA